MRTRIMAERASRLVSCSKIILAMRLSSYESPVFLSVSSVDFLFHKASTIWPRPFIFSANADI